MKVLVLSVSTGQGHNVTARAICEQLESIGCEAEMLDVFEYVSHLLGETVSRGYLMAATNAGLAYRGAYRLAEMRKKAASDLSLTRGAGGMIGKRLLRYINGYSPDVIICTHVFASLTTDILKCQGLIGAKTIGVLTDFMFHPYWEEALSLDYVVTPNERLLWEAKRKGFSEAQILPFGIPIHPKFTQSIKKPCARKLLGLDPAKMTVLIMGGSMGYGNLEYTVRMLDRFPADIQMIAVCGNNTKVKMKIDSLITKKKLLCLGYVDYIERLMDASDCIISKPGGITTSEALAKGLPMIIVDPIPGQEERNAEFLTNNGVAMAVTSTSTLDDVLYQLLADPRKIKLMKEAVRLIAKPDSTRDLCEFIMRLETDKRNMIGG